VPLEAWLPIGLKLPGGKKAKLALYQGQGYQIIELTDGSKALIAKQDLAKRWLVAGLMDTAGLESFAFGDDSYAICSSGPDHMLAPIADCRSPSTASESLAFALALKETRAIDAESPLQDGIYVERFSRLLPTYSLSSRTADDVVLGYWLTGGATVSVTSFRRLRQMLSWMEPAQLKKTIEAAGFAVDEVVQLRKSKTGSPLPVESPQSKEKSAQPLVEDEAKMFRLPGRPALEFFFNEHVVDIIQNQERYQALGIGFPSAIVLHGPPGCGKTFAVEQLVNYLGWPSYQIDASSVASPYIHDTSKKVAQVFEQAIQSAPSVLVIDEMEAFLADRQMGSGSSHHRVEEVAEFLRRIPEAIKSNVLIVAMTNRVEMIDPAILRRGRFDHIIKVDMATMEEVSALLSKLTSELPCASDIDVGVVAERLAGRPLSDVAFLVREGARLAVRSGRSKLDQSSLLKALTETPARESADSEPRKIGFV